MVRPNDDGSSSSLLILSQLLCGWMPSALRTCVVFVYGDDDECCRRWEGGLQQRTATCPPRPLYTVVDSSIYPHLEACAVDRRRSRSPLIAGGNILFDIKVKIFFLHI